MEQRTVELSHAPVTALGVDDNVCHRFVEVVLDAKVQLPYDSLTYGVPDGISDEIAIGDRVIVPFRTRHEPAYVVREAERGSLATIRPIDGKDPKGTQLLDWQIALAEWIAHRYVAPMSEVLKAMIPQGVRKGRKLRKTSARVSKSVTKVRSGGDMSAPVHIPTLTAAQQAAADPVCTAITKRESYRLLLHGITGSGKTEVYMAGIDTAITMHRQALMIVPEIALTPQMIERFGTRFPNRCAILHSALTTAERAQEWLRIADGQVDVVIGSRSALFAPVPDLGLVILDEEDASSYKQERTPRYHAVEVALALGDLRHAPVILGSATPRIETYYRAHTGDLALAHLTERFNQRELPKVQCVDLRDELQAGNRSTLSKALSDALERCHSAGGQSLLFLNRRGLATLVLCRSCGMVLSCTQCTSNMVYHATTRRCHCHYCGTSVLMPQVCAGCGSTSIRQLGGGTERVEHEVRDAFPDLRIVRMDRDTMTDRDAYVHAYEAFARREADCLIGTQMVAKGWDLGGVRLVGIVNADGALHFPDYRSAEVTFSLITQVAGRTGRGDEAAEVILQTYTPDHYAIQHALTHDYAGFAHQEIRIRKQWDFPPFTQMIVCTVSHIKDDKAKAMAIEAAERISATITPESGISLLGPTPAIVHQLKGEYRWQLLIRGVDLDPLYTFLPRGAGWSVDVDPGM